jgi:hypothetical protein
MSTHAELYPNVNFDEPIYNPEETNTNTTVAPMTGTPVTIFTRSLGVPQLPDTGVWLYPIPSTRCAHLLQRTGRSPFPAQATIESLPRQRQPAANQRRICSLCRDALCICIY